MWRGAAAGSRGATAPAATPPVRRRRFDPDEGSSDDAAGRAAAAAADRVADQLEILTAAIRAAAETIADAIRNRPGAHEEMSAQGAVS